MLPSVYRTPSFSSPVDALRRFLRFRTSHGLGAVRLQESPSGRCGRVPGLCACALSFAAAFLCASGQAAPRQEPLAQLAQQVGVTKDWRLLRYTKHGDHCLLVPPSFTSSNPGLFAGECSSLASKLDKGPTLVFFGLSTPMRDVSKSGSSLSFQDPTLVTPLSKVSIENGRYRLWCDGTPFDLTDVEQSSPGLTSALLQHARFVLAKEPTSYLFQVRDASVYFLVELDEPPNRNVMGNGRVYGPIKEKSDPWLIDPKPIPNLILTSIIGQILFEDPNTGTKLKLDWSDPAQPPTGGYFKKGSKSVEQKLVFIKPSDQSLLLLTKTFSRLQGMPCAYPSPGQTSP